MKIAYISGSTIPSESANSIHVMKMCNALSFRGDSVVLYAKANRNSHGASDAFSYYGVRNCFSIKNSYWPRLKGGGYLYSVISALRAKLDASDLVYSRSISAAFFSSLIGISTVYEAHSPIEDEGKISLFLFRRLLKHRHFQRLVVITNALAQHYIEHQGIDKHFVTVAPDGADLRQEDSGTNSFELITRGSGLNVGYVGHLYEGKGMEIISKIAIRCSFAKFHIVGGTESDLAYWRAECLHISNIEFYGHVQHSLAHSYMNSFDVLLLPNQKFVGTSGTKGANISSWTSPLKAFEYMATAKPIICSNLPVLREVFTDGENALLCNPEDPSEWICALDRLANDRALSQRIGQQAYFELKNKYSWVARASFLIDSITHQPA